MKILMKYLKPYKWRIVVALLLAGINQIFSMFDPVLFGKLIDQVANKHQEFYDKGMQAEYMMNGLKIILMMIGVAMVSRIAKAFQDYGVSVIIQKFGARIFTDGLQHAMGLAYQDFEDKRSGETLSILQKVRIDTEKFISYFINVLFATLVSVSFLIWYSINKSWILVPIYLLAIVLLGTLISFLSKKIKIIQKLIVTETTMLAGSTTESLRNIELIKSLGLTEHEVERLNKNTFKILGLELTKVKKVRSLNFVQGTMINLFRQSILFILMWFIFQNVLSPGELITMQFFSFFLFGALQEFGNIILSYREAEVSLNNFEALLSRPLEKIPEDAVEIGNIEALEFQNISFKHQTALRHALNDISFQVKKGETIAFVGPSGSGKTTLVKILVGLYRPEEGKILYNGVKSDHIVFDDLRKQIGFVTQDTQLFSGTIKENLLFVNPKASDELVLDALHKAACQNLLSRADKGLDTMIGEGGIKLSGGEKQRLSIARALLRKPNLLIFDEATSALDSLTEEEISATIRDISSEQNKITILIAHRLSTIFHADRIFVLEKGKIIETGKHQDLLNEKGLYFAMWRQQIGERN
ncbi:MAG: ABC transporter ATP-binding protein [Saprospiraceae bacterium]|nr:ABC transporter ATP-binding protein [Saprospiraceae bacterium]